MKRTLVISAVNFTEGGPLTVLRDCVNAARTTLPDWRIVVMAHDATLLATPGVEVMAFPETKTSWGRRLRLEWFGFKAISRALKPDLWLSLHDITPRVEAARQAVYCHNPAIFYRIGWREAWLEPKFLLFNLFYGFIYGSFIRRNGHVIVQQQWLREEFSRRFGALPMVVAHPSSDTLQTHGTERSHRPVVFFYPALPRVFKNLEILGEAVEHLQSRGIDGFEVRVTITGTENRYAVWLLKRFSNSRAIRFIGRQSSEQMKAQYSQASAVVFPSRLETWGLPITEAKARSLPLLVADAPYARETVGTYDAVSFFPPRGSEMLADLMQAVIQGTWHAEGNAGTTPAAPFASDWPQLIRLLTHDDVDSLTAVETPVRRTP